MVATEMQIHVGFLCMYYGIKATNQWSGFCLVPSPHFSARAMRFGSRGLSEFLFHSSWIRHRKGLEKTTHRD